MKITDKMRMDFIQEHNVKVQQLHFEDHDSFWTAEAAYGDESGSTVRAAIDKLMRREAKPT